MTTNIEWVQNQDGTKGETWNPVTGCSKISEGCRHCYAERMAKRLAGRYGYPEQPHHFDVTVHEDKLSQPSHWNKPRMIFVCSMGDLFHEDVPYSYQEDIFERIRWNPHHTFQVLTKRSERMNKVLEHYYLLGLRPLPNLWLGVTAENQEAADDRIPWLLKTPAAVRFVSIEPMLGHVDLYGYLPQKTERYISTNRSPNAPYLDWVICGGETGPGARTTEYKWVEDLFWECKMASIPFFFKKIGDNPDPNLVGAAITEYRQWPNAPITNNQSLPGGHS